MAYKVIIYENKTEKQFASLKNKFSDDVWKRMLDFLSTTPSQGKKEMGFRKYDLPDANRIIYDILKGNIVRILCAGNHNIYERFLDNHVKKKK